MRVEIVEAAAESLIEYANIPIAFEVRSRFECEVADGLATEFSLTERPVSEPYVKDYDAVDGEGTPRWLEQFDISRWGLFLARIDGVLAGGAAVAIDTPGLEILEGGGDMAALWDIRVSPEMRSRGVGTALFDHSRGWAAARGARVMRVETQNTNVPACRFYAARGCVLNSIERFAYPSLPEEIRLIWQCDLARAVNVRTSFLRL